MRKLILSAALTLGLALPAVASADSFARADLSVQDVQLIKIDGKGKGRGKGRYKHRGGYERYDDRDERRAYRQGYRDGAYDSYRPGSRRYARGQYLPREYQTYVVREYVDYGYPPPPPGAHYVRVGQDTYLTQIATGLILNALIGGGY
jgi:Ni/Co efflux regulator RcnB